MKSDSINCFSRCRKKWLMFTLTKCQNRQASVATVTSVHLERRRKCDGVTGSTEAEGRGGKLAQVNAVTLHGLCSNTQMKLCCGCGRQIRTCQSQSQHASVLCPTNDTTKTEFVNADLDLGEGVIFSLDVCRQSGETKVLRCRFSSCVLLSHPPWQSLLCYKVIWQSHQVLSQLLTNSLDF